MSYPWPGAVSSPSVCRLTVQIQGSAAKTPVRVLDALLFQLPLGQAGPHVVGVYQGPVQRKVVLPQELNSVDTRQKHPSLHGCTPKCSYEGRITDLAHDEMLRRHALSVQLAQTIARIPSSAA